MVVDPFGAVVPLGAGIAERADELLLLGIDADDRDVVGGAAIAQFGASVARAPAPFGAAGLRGAAGGTAARTIRRTLLVAEVALAIMLLVGAGLLVRSWWQVEGVDPGFRPERVLAMQIGAPALMAPAQRVNFYRGVLERIESLPGVERAGFISDAFISSSPERTLTTERDGAAVSPSRRDPSPTTMRKILPVSAPTAPRDARRADHRVAAGLTASDHYWNGLRGAYPAGAENTSGPTVVRVIAVRRLSATTCDRPSLSTVVVLSRVISRDTADPRLRVSGSAA